MSETTNGEVLLCPPAIKFEQLSSNVSSETKDEDISDNATDTVKSEDMTVEPHFYGPTKDETDDESQVPENNNDCSANLNCKSNFSLIDTHIVAKTENIDIKIEFRDDFVDTADNIKSSENSKTRLFHGRTTSNPPNDSRIYQCQNRKCKYETHCRKKFAKHIAVHGFDGVRSKQYVCKCSYKTHEQQYYINHCVKTGERYLNCTSCKYTCKFAAVYHRRNCMKRSVYRCEMCSFKTRFKNTYYSHKRKHTDKYHYCEKCDYKTNTKCRLVRHMIKHLEEFLFSCDFCSYQTKCESYLQKHKLIHTDQSHLRIYACKQCSYKAKAKHVLNKHKLIHADQNKLKIFSCEHCDFRTRHEYSFKIHNKGHMEDKSQLKMFSCEQCTFETRYLNSIRSHKRRHLNQYQKESYIHKCTVCSYSTLDKTNLNRHMKKHKQIEDIPVFRCKDCSFQSIYDQNLKRHIVASHKSFAEGKFKFTCDQCHFTTNEKHGFQYHLQCHKSERELFSCEYCEFSTFHNGNLHRHYKKMHDDKTKTLFPHKCQECDFKTTSKKKLETHVEAEHSGVIYHCNQCSFKTKKHFLLANHEFQHVPIKKLKSLNCEFCLFKTANKYTYKFHVRSHKDNPNILNCKLCPFQSLHGALLQKHYHYQHSFNSNKELTVKIVPLEHMAYLSLAAFSYERNTNKPKSTTSSCHKNKKLIIKVVSLERLLYYSLR